MEIRKIGVLRANALGDLILSLPALHNLKEAFPSAELVLIGREKHLSLLQGRPGPVDKVIALPDFIHFSEEGMQDSFERRLVLEDLRMEGFDLLVQLHGGGRFTNPFIREIGAKFCIGARTDEGIPLDLDIPYNRYQHEVLRQLEIVSLITHQFIPVAPSLVATDEEVALGKEIMYSQSLEEGAPLVLLNPGATDPRRRWPAEEFAKLKDLLLVEGAEVLVNIGPGEEELANFFPGRAVKLSLTELIGVLHHASLVVSNDTGTMHLAQAMDRATVSLWWHRNLINYSPLLWQHHRVLLSWEDRCPDCDSRGMDPACGHLSSWLTSIKLEKVYEASKALLAQRRSPYENRSRSVGRRTIGQDLYTRDQAGAYW